MQRRLHESFRRRRRSSTPSTASARAQRQSRLTRERLRRCTRRRGRRRKTSNPNTARAVPTAAPGFSCTTRWAFCATGPVSSGAFAMAWVLIFCTFCLTCAVNSWALPPGPPTSLMPRTLPHQGGSQCGTNTNEGPATSRKPMCTQGDHRASPMRATAAAGKGPTAAAHSRLFTLLPGGPVPRTPSESGVRRGARRAGAVLTWTCRGPRQVHVSNFVNHLDAVGKYPNYLPAHRISMRPSPLLVTGPPTPQHVQRHGA